MSTLVTRRTDGIADPTLPLALPSFDIDLAHFWHPANWTDGLASWPDSWGTLPLPVYGDATIDDQVDAGHPFLKLTTGASFAAGQNIPAADIGTILAIVKIATADALVTNGTILNNGRSSIQMNTTGSTAVTFSSGGAATTAALDKWHLFSLTTPPVAPFYSVYTVDGYSTTATAQAAGAPNTVRVGTTVPSHKAMSVAAVLTSHAPIPAATITGPILAMVREWFKELTWA